MLSPAGRRAQVRYAMRRQQARTASSGRRAGRRVNAKRVYRLWRLGGLGLPRRRLARKQRTGERVQPLATAPNEVWT